MNDIFDDKNISPMLLSESNGKPFDSPDHIFELKMDGVRTLLYLDHWQIEIRNKRNIRGNDRYPELLDIHRQIKKRCILDGELIVIKDGVPSFYEVQRRSLMSQPFKIQLEAKKLPVSFVAFDILYYDDHAVMDLPLMERKALLSQNIKESERFAVSRYIEQEGVALFSMAKAQNLEGIVAKRKESKYYPGKRTNDWAKIKYLQSDDFVVCGFILKDAGITSIILGQYDGDQLIRRSHVTLGVSRQEFDQIARLPRTQCPFAESEVDAQYVEPQLVCTVEYMERTGNGGLRQTVFRGLRDDKEPHDCVIW